MKTHIPIFVHRATKLDPYTAYLAIALARRGQRQLLVAAVIWRPNPTDRPQS